MPTTTPSRQESLGFVSLVMGRKVLEAVAWQQQDRLRKRHEMDRLLRGRKKKRNAVYLRVILDVTSTVYDHFLLTKWEACQ
jgi:hypothetical protein